MKFVMNLLGVRLEDLRWRINVLLNQNRVQNYQVKTSNIKCHERIRKPYPDNS